MFIVIFAKQSYQQMVRFLPCEADERFSKFAASLDLYAGLSLVQVEINDTLSSCLWDWLVPYRSS